MQTLFLLPVAGEIEGTHSNAKQFYVLRNDAEPIQVKSRVLMYSAGKFGEREHFLHPTIQSAFLSFPVRLAQHELPLPCLVAQEPVGFEFKAQRARVSLAYRRFEFDPVYYARSTHLRHLNSRVGHRTPYNPMNFQFEPGDRVPVWHDIGGTDRRLVMQFESIPEMGQATVSLLTWEPISLAPGMIFRRRKTWDQGLFMTPRSFQRNFTVDFAILEELL